METKICTKCHLPKDLDCFGKHKLGKNGLRAACKECEIKRIVVRRAEKKAGLPTLFEQRPKEHGETDNPDYAYSTSLKSLYGITIWDYNNMYKQQEGRCAICNRHQSKLSRRLVVDHNHVTGRIRGLLCMTCNRGLGCFTDSADVLNRASDYLNSRN